MKIRHQAGLRVVSIAAAAIAMLFASGMGLAAANELCVESPDFDVITLDTENISSAALKGDKPVYLKFWLTTCPQCMAEMPHFKEAHAHYGDDVQFIAVNLGVDGDTQDVVRDAMAELELGMPGVVDEEGHLQSAFGVVGTPTHVVIDRDGRVRHLGHKADEQLDEMLAEVRIPVSVEE